MATQGVPGAAALAVLAFGLVRGGARAWRRCAADRPFLAALFASLAAWVVQGLVGFTTVGCGELVLVCAALLSRWGEPAPATDPPAGREVPERNGLGLGAAAGLAPALFAVTFGVAP